MFPIHSFAKPDPHKPLAEQTIGEIVANQYQTASIFRDFGIDFCCGGKRTLQEVCEKQQIDETELIRALSQASGSAGERNLPFHEWELPFLIDYILQVHHAYVRKKCPEIEAYSEKVARVHGEHRPETIQVAHLFQALQNELMSHMEKEERILFPYIKMLCTANKEERSVAPPPFGTAKNPIRMMESEHEAAGDMLRELRRLTSQYQAPEGACSTYQVLYASLEEFEKDLHQHVHLENNLLFPKALELEKAIIS